MEAWKIYHKGESEPYYSIKCKLEYSSEMMGSEYVTLEIKSPTPIAFAVGDYLIYRNEYFYISQIPSIKKRARRGSVGDAFEYGSVKFESAATRELPVCIMRDVVLYTDSEKPFTALSDFNLYCASVWALLERIKANLDRVYGEDTWHIFYKDFTCKEDDEAYTLGSDGRGYKLWAVGAKQPKPDDTIVEGRKNIVVSFNKTSIWDALGIVSKDDATGFNLKFVIKGRNIIVNSVGEVLPTTQFKNSDDEKDPFYQYGKSRGLYSIERNTDDSQEIITRLRAYGNSTNMPRRFYYNYGVNCRLFLTDTILTNFIEVFPGKCFQLKRNHINPDGKLKTEHCDKSIFSERNIKITEGQDKRWRWTYEVWTCYNEHVGGMINEEGHVVGGEWIEHKIDQYPNAYIDTKDNTPPTEVDESLLWTELSQDPNWFKDLIYPEDGYTTGTTFGIYGPIGEPQQVYLHQKEIATFSHAISIDKMIKEWGDSYKGLTEYLENYRSATEIDYFPEITSIGIKSLYDNSPSGKRHWVGLFFNFYEYDTDSTGAESGWKWTYNIKSRESSGPKDYTIGRLEATDYIITKDEKKPTDTSELVNKWKSIWGVEDVLVLESDKDPINLGTVNRYDVFFDSVVIFNSEGKPFYFGKEHKIYADNKNVQTWPVTWLEADPDCLVPNNMNINFLMLPGFGRKEESLDSWVRAVYSDKKTYKICYDKLAAMGYKYYDMSEPEAIEEECIKTYFRFSEDPLDPYIDSVNIDRIGLVEGEVKFDGSADGNSDDIYPSLKWLGNNFIDEADLIKDNGVFDKDGMTISQSPFHVYVNLPFDPKAHCKIYSSNTAETFTMHMQNGMCGGRDFNVQNVTKMEDGRYRFHVERLEDEDLHLWFPYDAKYDPLHPDEEPTSEAFQIRAGDEYIITDMDSMPDEYVLGSALNALLPAAIEYLSKNCDTAFKYSVEVSKEEMQRQHDRYLRGEASKSAYLSIHAGDVMQIEDDDLNIIGAITIDKLNIKETEGCLPQYQVTLSDHKDIGTIQKQQNRIDSIVNTINSGILGGGGAGYDAEAIAQIVENVGATRFLSKVSDDYDAANITFGKNITVNGSSRFGGDVIFDSTIKSKEFMPGSLGYGWELDKNGNMTAGSLTLRQSLNVPKLNYNEITATNEITIQSAGGISQVENVEISRTDPNRGTMTLHLEGGEVGKLQAGDKCFGIFHNIISNAGYKDSQEWPVDDGATSINIKKGDILILGEPNTVSRVLRATRDWSATLSKDVSKPGEYNILAMRDVLGIRLDMLQYKDGNYALSTTTVDTITFAKFTQVLIADEPEYSLCRGVYVYTDASGSFDGVFEELGDSEVNDEHTEDSLNMNFHFAGFKTSYLEVLKVSGKSNEIVEYRLRCATDDTWSDNTHPQAEMNIAQYASDREGNRQQMKLTTNNYTVLLYGMTDWTYGPKNIGSVWGNLDGFSINIRKWGSTEESLYNLNGWGFATGNFYHWGSDVSLDRPASIVSQQLEFTISNIPLEEVQAYTHEQIDTMGWLPITRYTKEFKLTEDTPYLYERWRVQLDNGLYDEDKLYDVWLEDIYDDEIKNYSLDCDYEVVNRIGWEPYLLADGTPYVTADAGIYNTIGEVHVKCDRYNGADKITDGYLCYMFDYDNVEHEYTEPVSMVNVTSKVTFNWYADETKQVLWRTKSVAVFEDAPSFRVIEGELYNLARNQSVMFHVELRSGSKEITTIYDDKCFEWYRVSGTSEADQEADRLWAERRKADLHRKYLIVRDEDVYKNARFRCRFNDGRNY